MAVDLVDYVPSLRREIQPPGSTMFDATVLSDADAVGYLADAFWEARLDGFVLGYKTYPDGPVDVATQIVPVVTTGADIPRQDLALVVLYAGIKILRNRILNMNTSFRAKAGPVEFEQQNSATMLAEMLKQLKATKDRILEALDDVDGTGVLVLDAYSTRVFQPISYGGGIELSG